MATAIASRETLLTLYAALGRSLKQGAMHSIAPAAHRSAHRFRFPAETKKAVSQRDEVIKQLALPALARFEPQGNRNQGIAGVQ